MNKKKEKEQNTQINTSNQTMKQIREIKNLIHWTKKITRNKMIFFII